MSSTERPSDEPAGRDDIAPPDPTSGQAGDGQTQAGAEGEGADKSTDR